MYNIPYYQYIYYFRCCRHAMSNPSPRMHLSVVDSKRGSNSYRTVLLRSSYRDKNGKSQKKTHANLTHLPPHWIELIRGLSMGKQYLDVNDAFDIVGVRKHGAVEALLRAFQQLGLNSLIASVPQRNRGLVCALIGARIIRPHTKLATCRWWHDTTLPQHFGVEDADVDELYGAMDWLLKRQNVIEGKLVRRHLQAGGLALFDLSSSYFEGTECPLAEYGYSRDGKPGKLQVNFGLLCDRKGRPLSVTVCRGNLRDSQTLLPQVKKLKKRFGIDRLVVAGDRGMITQVNIDGLGKLDGVDWITALKSITIRKLVKKGALPLHSFDEVNLFEVFHPDYPGQRLVACRNRQLAQKRAHTRESLLVATEQQLSAIEQRVVAGRLKGRAEIGLKVGEKINSRKMKKHFICEISERSFSFRRNLPSIAAEAALDGIYVIRTSLDEQSMTAAECVRNYKRLCNVERAFRTIKTISLRVRPIHHRTADRVRAHIFLCMLAYYVEWHMREAWRELLFADPHLDELTETRDPVMPAIRSGEARKKAATARTEDGSAAYCFRTLIEHLETITVNTCRANSANGDGLQFELTSVANARQQQALDLLNNINKV